MEVVPAIGKARTPAVGLAPWLAMLLVAGAGSGCNGTAPLDPQAQGILDAARAAYAEGDDRQVIGQADAFLQRYARSRGADQALYYRARAKYRLKDLDGAAADMAAALDRTKAPSIRGSGWIVQGDIAFDRGEMTSASASYREALRHLLPGESPADYAMYRLGSALQRLGEWDQADLQFDRLAHQFDGTELAERASRKVRARAWTVQVGAYDSRAAATDAAVKFKTIRYPLAIRYVRAGGKPFFVVQSGRFATYAAAAATLVEIRRVQADAFVTVTQ